MTCSSTATLPELIQLQDNLRKTPFNLEWDAAKIGDRIKLAQAFLKKIRGYKDDYINSHYKTVYGEYQGVKVCIPEFDKIINDVESEREVIADLKANYQDLSLKEIIEKRQILQYHKYCKDACLSQLLLNKEVELLRKDFELNSANEFEEKPLFD